MLSGQNQAGTGVLAAFDPVKRANARALPSGLLKTPSSQAGTQSVQVLENTMGWIPAAACPRMIESGAGMTNF